MRFSDERATRDAQATSQSSKQLKQAAIPLQKLAQALDRSFPAKMDAMATKISFLTPRVLGFSFLLLLLSIIASRTTPLNPNFLWGIPALGAIGLSLGLWIWTASVLLRPDLSPEARASLNQLSLFQRSILGVGLLVIGYFIALAFRLW
jgi:hypothetical protein